MKKSILFLFLFGCFHVSIAQKNDKPQMVSLSFGVSLAASITMDTSNLWADIPYQPASFTRNGTPAFVLTYDKRLERRWSIGAAMSYQHFNILSSDTTGGFIAETANVNRIHFTVRSLIHYGKKEKVDFYSGFKLGYFMQTVNDRTGTSYYNAMQNMAFNRVTLGLIPIGVRWLVHEDFGINFETSLGRATMFQLGANYKW